MSQEREYGDAINAQGSHGFINRPEGPVHQHYHGEMSHDVRGLPNPYLGLAAFTYDERHKYAGRETQISAALAKLTTPGAQQVLLFVTGASGSGKSSFAQAGLLPALEAHYAERHQTLRRAVIRPSQQPLVQLADAFHQLGLRAAHPDFPLPTWYRLLRTGTPTPQINLLVIDQFEEVFTQSRADQGVALVSFLTQLPPFARLHTHILVTMRADYLPEVFAYPDLYDAAKAGIDLRVMTVPELHRAIQQPLQHGGAAQGKRFESALRDRLATDTAQDATYLPLLQVTLAHLWDRGHLTLSAYGTLTDAIQHRAEDVYTHAADPDTLLAIFLDLVEVSLNDDARRDVRRRRTRADLTQTDPERGTLIETLCQARLLSADVEHHMGQDVEVVDIIHESLLTNWPRLRDAITAQRDRLQQRARFEHWLRDWEDHHRTDDYLLDGVRLSEAEELAAQRDVALQSGAAQELLKWSLGQREAKRHRQLRQAQGIAGILTIFLLIAVGAGVVAFQQQQIANDNAAEADRQRDQAEANATEARESLALTLATTASTWPDVDEAFVLALAAVRLDEYTPRTHDLASDIIEQYPLQNVYLGHDDDIASAVYSPDGTTIFSGSDDGTLRLWDVATSKTLHIFEDHNENVRSVGFSPNGQTVLSGSEDGTVHLWDVVTGNLLHTLEGHTEAVTSVAYSPDGEQVLSGSCSTHDGDNCVEGELRLWDTLTGKMLHSFEGHEGWVMSVAYSPDEEQVLSGSCGTRDGDNCDEGELRLWDATTGEVVRTFEGHEGWVTSVAFSSDGQTVLSGSSDGTLWLWNVKTGEVLRTFEGDKGEVRSVAFSPDGQTVLSGSCDTHDGYSCVTGELRLWNVTTGEVLRTFEGHDGGVRSVSYSPDGQTVLSGSCSTRDGYYCREGELRLWDITAEEVLRIFEKHGEWISSVAYSQSGETVLSGSGDGVLRLWDVMTGELVHSFEGHSEPVNSVAYSPDDSKVLSGSSDNTLRLWDVETGAVLRIFEGHSGWVESVAFSSDGTTMLSSSLDGTMPLWNVTTGEVMHIFEEQRGWPAILAYSPDDSKVLSGSSDNTLRLWDVETGAVLRIFEGHRGRVTSVAYSPDGQTILSGSQDTTLRLWDVATGEMLHTFEEHMGLVTSVAFSPDGLTILSGSSDGTLRLWEVQTGAMQRIFKGHTDWVRSVAFSPDGAMVISGSSDDTMRLWDTRPLTEIACTDRHIDPEAEAAMREQFGIPDDLVLCPEE